MFFAIFQFVGICKLMQRYASFTVFFECLQGKWVVEGSDICSVVFCLVAANPPIAGKGLFNLLGVRGSCLWMDCTKLKLNASYGRIWRSHGVPTNHPKPCLCAGGRVQLN
jgi:hypothetical protein